MPTQPGPKGSFEDHLKSARYCASIMDYSKAEYFFRKALERQQNSAIALAGLGQSLCCLKRESEGIPLLYRAGMILKRQAIRTRNTKDLLDLAYQLVYRHAPKEALDLAEAAIQLTPDSANAYYIAALSQQGLNRLKEAVRLAELAFKLAPNESNATILLASLYTKSGRLSESRQLLESLIQKPGTANKDRAHLELGIALDKLGEYNSAFEHISEAGRLALDSPAIRQIDKRAVFAEINQIRSNLDPNFLKSAASRIKPDDLPSPIFLIGFYRSGTTLIEQILAAHEQIITSNEAHLLSHVLTELKKLTPGSKNVSEALKALDGEQIAHLRKQYWQTVEQALGKTALEHRFVDKTALNLLNIELINALFPEAQVIFAVRDPRDVCLSCFMQPFAPSPLTVHFLSWEDGARFYAAAMEYWIVVRNHLTVKWKELRYEDILESPEDQFRPLLTQIGLPWSDRCLEYYRHAQNRSIKTPSFSQVTQPLYKTSAQRWRHYQRHFEPIQSYMRPYIELFGYASQ